MNCENIPKNFHGVRPALLNIYSLDANTFPFSIEERYWNDMGFFMAHECHVYERNVIVTMYCPMSVPVECCRFEGTTDGIRVSRGCRLDAQISRPNLQGLYPYWQIALQLLWL